jgi:hypothetical protein
VPYKVEKPVSQVAEFPFPGTNPIKTEKKTVAKKPATEKKTVAKKPATKKIKNPKTNSNKTV